MCLGTRFRPNKQAATTKQALLEVLDLSPQPFASWSDNRLEFAGVFHELLQQRGIIQTHTQADNPQQNRKCERFWQTLEMAKESQDVDRLVEEYNETPHFGLRKVQRTRGVGPLTPKEVWNDPSQHCIPFS
jgi:transposase InsO family protein